MSLQRYQEFIAERTRLLERIKELEAENAELRKRLGEPVTPMPPASSAMQNLSLQEKIDLFCSLFKGRDDVFARRWYSKTSGKAGYQPVCQNDTNWVERINNVGSDGTDILVKAMVNIMLINVFKKKAARKSGDFIIHCMMDEIGRLHPNNIKGILQFANSRNIYLINSSPTSYNPFDYKYTYLLSKHGVKTRVDKLLKRTK